MLVSSLSSFHLTFHSDIMKSSSESSRSTGAMDDVEASEQQLPVEDQKKRQQRNGMDDVTLDVMSLHSDNSTRPDGMYEYPEGGAKAWLVVLGSFSGLMASFGLVNTVGTLQAYLSTHQLASYDPSTIGWIFSTYLAISFFCGVQIGPVFDAKGPRWLVAAGSVLLLGGTFTLAESKGESASDPSLP